MLRASVRGARVGRLAGAVRCSIRGVSTIPPYLHETEIPTYHFQDSLPKLEVPKLEDSLKKYLYFAKPLVTAEELETTAGLVKAFQDGEGAKLQEELIALDKQKYSSFYNEMWFDMYLDSRDPLPLNYNPQVTFKDDPIASKNDQAVRTADLVASSLRFYRTLLDEKLIPDIFHTQPEKSETPLYKNVCRMLPRQVSFYGSYAFGAYPLDMSQYKNLFSSTRIPHQGKDELRKFNPEQSKHIVVQRGNSFYTLPVLTDDLSIIDNASIERGIRAILADEQAQQAEKFPVGVLTTMDRDAWASARSSLEASSSTNKATLEAIDSALFAICLDDESPESYQEISSTMLHGNARNRWFDKSFQLIVAANGKACVNFEHAWGDGVAVLRYFNEVYDDSIATAPRDKASTDVPPVASGAGSCEVGVPRRLEFELTSDDKASIEAASKTIDSTIASLEVGTFESVNWGKADLVKSKIGADGFMQMGFQLAHLRLKGYTPATYESASTAAFKHGRTETIRSATPEAAAFAQAFCDASVSAEAREAALRTAVKKHGSITKDALMGKGMDRHLFALRVLAARRGETPAIYTDKSYETLAKIILSTSTLASEGLFAGGFGPVNKDCYALAYGISDEGARTAVATYGLGSDAFASELEKAYDDMLSVLQK